MVMRNFIKIIFLAIIFLFFNVTHALAQVTPKFIRVGAYENYPKIFTDDNDEVAGLFSDILEYIATKENWRIEYVSGSFDDGLNNLENGNIDIMVDVAYSEERAAKFDFTSQSVIGSWGVVYVRKDSQINSFSDLDNKKIGILQSSVYLKGNAGINAYIKSFNLNVDLVEIPEYPQVFEMLERREIDAAVVSRIFGSTNQKNYPELEATDIFFQPTELRFALRKENPDNQYLIERTDFWLRKLKSGQDNFYQDTLKKYGILELSATKEVIPQWIWYVGGAILGILIISLLFNLMMRRAKFKISRELRSKEYLLEGIIQKIPVFILSADKNGIINFFGGRGVNLAGLDAESVLGKSISDVFKGDPAMGNLKRALAGEPVEFIINLGKGVWLVNLSPHKTGDDVSSIVGVAFEYTEKDKLEKAKSDFISLAAHHLRTPPTEIKWAQELLWPTIKDVLTGKELELWKTISRANQSIIHLADSLSLSSWLELATFSEPLKKTDVENLFDRELNKFSDLIEEKKLKVLSDINVGKEIYLDHQRFATIVSSLLSNALRYSFEGGIVNVSLKYAGGKLLLMVKDNGWGIPKSEQREVFTRLFRSSNVEDKDVVGLGLSLYICKKIIDKSQGKIWFESEENKGSTFYVEFPAKEVA